MQRLLEILLGLERGFLSRQGDFSINFNPQWPWQATTGAAIWNVLLVAAALVLVIWVYRRDGRSRPVRISLGIIRGLLLAFVIAMLNRPVLTLGQNRTEPSVLPILIDDSISMRLRDVGDTKAPSSRLQAVENLLSAPMRSFWRISPKNIKSASTASTLPPSRSRARSINSNPSAKTRKSKKVFAV